MANPFQSVLPAMKTSGEDSKLQSPTSTSTLTVSAKGGVPSYKRGTRFVKKTGIARIHKGEAILNARDAKKYRSSGKVSAAASSLGAGKKKVPSKNQRLIRVAGHELKENPPKVVKSTMRKKGPEAARKQNIAIMLSKARAAGADIPEK